MRMVSFIVGAVWLIVGVCCLRTGKKGTPGERRYALTMGAVNLLFAAAGIAGAMANSGKLFLTGLLLPISFWCLFAGAKVARLTHRCRIPVSGTYLRYHRYSGGLGQCSYAPVFSYTYAGQPYEAQVPAGYPSLKRLEEHYRPGARYTIYVDEAHPGSCVDNPRISFTYVLIGLIGIGVLAAYGGLMLV